jgi:hypothetical protein
MQPHACADHFKDMDDAEWPLAVVRSSSDRQPQERQWNVPEAGAAVGPEFKL